MHWLKKCLNFFTDLNSPLSILNSCLFQAESWSGSAAAKGLLGNLHMFADVICLVSVIYILHSILPYLATLLLLHKLLPVQAVCVAAEELPQVVIIILVR